MSDVMTASEHREAASEALRRAEESFQRSDTDGFLSQWASGLTAQLHQRQAEVLEAGGKADFPGLFDAQGRRVKAKLVEVVDRYRGYGKQTKELWLVLSASGQALHWVPRQSSVRWVQNPDPKAEGENWNGHLEHDVPPSPRSKMYSLGLHEQEESAPAKATMKGRGRGLSGTAWVATVRTDEGYPAGAVVYGS